MCRKTSSPFAEILLPKLLTASPFRPLSQKSDGPRALHRLSLCNNMRGDFCLLSLLLYFNQWHFSPPDLLYIGLFCYLLLVFLRENEDSMMADILPLCVRRVFQVPRILADAK